VKPGGVEEESDLDTSKLKGVLWPGMDLFDSATAEMKRMRNQRKDRSVLEQMKMNSADVEPTELVFDSNGDLRKARHIFDDATDSGPVSVSPILFTAFQKAQLTAMHCDTAKKIQCSQLSVILFLTP
jgi:geranylgeranyl transferase type-2 subunit beta